MSERLVRKLFPNIPSPEHTKKLSLTSDALAYIKQYGSKELAISNLEWKCKMCAKDDCGGLYQGCEYPKIIEIIKEI